MTQRFGVEDSQWHAGKRGRRFGFGLAHVVIGLLDLGSEERIRGSLQILLELLSEVDGEIMEDASQDFVF